MKNATSCERGISIDRCGLLYFGVSASFFSSFALSLQHLPSLQQEPSEQQPPSFLVADVDGHSPVQVSGFPDSEQQLPVESVQQFRLTVVGDDESS